MSRPLLRYSVLPRYSATLVVVVDRLSTMPPQDSLIPDGYAQFLADLKTHVTAAKLQAQRVLNTALVDLYWNIGNRILEEQERQGWAVP